MGKIQIYTKASCPYCIRAKQLLEGKGLPFEEINLEGKDEELQALRKRTNYFTVPQIFIGEKMIGGYTELAGLNASGELDKMVR